MIVRVKCVSVNGSPKEVGADGHAVVVRVIECLAGEDGVELGSVHVLPQDGRTRATERDPFTYTTYTPIKNSRMSSYIQVLTRTL